MYSCEICDYWTYAVYEYDEHVQENHPSCNSCDRVFRSHDSLRQHYRDSQRHDYCGICDRHFQSPAALRGHQETHLPRDIKCPRCDRGFPSASAMAKHAEQGKCFGLTHKQILSKVRDWEASSGNPNFLTVPRLGYSDTNASPGLIEASEAAYNGDAYECYFCQREFRSLVSLNQHLNSGVHFSKEYRCKKCGHTATCYQQQASPRSGRGSPEVIDLSSSGSKQLLLSSKPRRSRFFAPSRQGFVSSTA